MKKYWIILMLWSPALVGQSLKDHLSDVVTNYVLRVNDVLQSGSDPIAAEHGFLSLFDVTAHLEDWATGSLWTPRAYWRALKQGSFSDGTRLEVSEARYCDHGSRSDIFYIHLVQAFVGTYLPTQQILPKQRVTLMVLRKAKHFLVVEVKKSNLSRAALADEDGDEIPAVCDNCVCLAGGLENKGGHLVDACPCGAAELCPDTDEDGTPDKSDKCPNQFGEPEDGGCPNYTEKELEAIKRIQEAKKRGADALDLFSLQLTRLPNAIQKLTGLQKLSLQHNQISDLSALKDLKQLNDLNLQDNKIQNFNLDLSLFPNLKQLILKNNPIQNIPKEIVEMENCIEGLRAYQKQQKH